jgi:transposase
MTYAICGDCDGTYIEIFIEGFKNDKSFKKEYFYYLLEVLKNHNLNIEDVDYYFLDMECEDNE